MEKINRHSNFKIYTIPCFHDVRGSVTDISSIFGPLKFITIEEIKNIICVHSQKNVLRGLHFQKNVPQKKIVHLVKGKILDVIINIDSLSPDYLQPQYFFMESEKNNCLCLPKNFLHGYRVLSEEAIVQYFIDQPYLQEHQLSVRFDDEKLDINWGGDNKFILSERDKNGIGLDVFLDKIK